jgi:hypothetical protein
MTLPNPIQPHVLFGLDDQRIVLNKLYKLSLQTARNRVELEQSWRVLAREDIQAQPNPWIQQN